MRTAIFFLLLSISCNLYAQKECATQSYLESVKLTDRATARNLEAAESFVQQVLLKKKSSHLRLTADYTIRIPVVVHVLYYSDSYNISEAQIKGQIDVLNRDFRRLNADTSNTPIRFKSIAADVHIEFVLATADPKGRATNGIVRKKTGVKYWNLDDKIKFSSSGGDDAWDSQSYLNIWLGDMRTYLGYSSAIGGPANKDGIVINTSAFGVADVGGNYTLGRTLTHEVGHWLGLKHIWGDTYCGDDGVADTPVQGGFTAGCPNGFRSSCSNGALGDMYMNYMDLTNDACMNLFTKGQRDRMRIVFDDEGPRQSMLSSKGLNEPWSEEIPLPDDTTVTVSEIKLYPNPARSEFIIDIGSDESWIGKNVQLINMNGAIIIKVRIASQKHNTNLSGLPAGIYFIQGTNGKKQIKKKLVVL